MEVDYHFIREKVIRGDLQVHFVSSVDQLDIFTKGLSSVCFQLPKDKLRVTENPFRLRGHVRINARVDPG